MGRWFMVLGWCHARAVFGRSAAAAEVAPLRSGLTPVFLDDQTAFVNAWRIYLERRLDAIQAPSSFVGPLRRSRFADADGAAY